MSISVRADRRLPLPLPPNPVAWIFIALVGMPLVIGYTFLIYRAFRGPVVLHEDSY